MVKARAPPRFIHDQTMVTTGTTAAAITGGMV